MTVSNSAHEQCANCDTRLLGPHCYACGQPVEGMAKHFLTFIGDFFNSVFGLDSRIARTLGPLLLRPGFLSNEYLAGRRVRYVSPVRLFVFLCLIAFFAVQMSTDWNSAAPPSGAGVETGGDNILSHVEASIDAAATVEEVERLRERALGEARRIARESGDVPGLSGVMSGMEQVVLQRARLRIEVLQGSPPGPSAGDAAPGGNAPWKPQLGPLQMKGGDGWSLRPVDQLAGNIQRIRQDPNAFKNALVGAIPFTLFMLLPLFALMLRILYLFSRWLYLEHLLVALHSHAFLSMALLLMVLVFWLQQWLGGGYPAAAYLCNLLLGALLVWMPLYLLLMQKRVYGQGWPLTILKFGILGVGYFSLLVFGTTLTVMARLMWL
ncbi:DUF3667 domain-containing protein [Microbulbifer taiwanensis]|uniref:DUF3667 domain-containing protein n=1 Tax=Microbulbifer taiwanensis TaxID=986746 RepID=A0ABW1YNJ6_9GAMM|nr:DUF3667 domain-containing protein [Microbulbifer taiwanensis]